jgi:hypothetical protein
MGGSQSQISFTDLAETITLHDPSGQFTGNGTHIVTGPVSATVDGIFVFNAHLSDLVIDDSADSMVRSMTLKTATGDPTTGLISGLPSGRVNFKYGQVDVVRITTGPVAGNVVNVQATGGYGATRITGTAAETVNVVGSAVGLASISAPLYIKNTEHSTALTVDDSADKTARTAALSALAGAEFGTISGLGGADILYAYTNTNGVTINTGTNALDVVDVQKTGPVPVKLVGHAAEAVNVGYAGMALGVQGLTVENVGGLSTLTVDDSADPKIFKPTFKTFLKPGAPVLDALGVLSSPTSSIAYVYASTQSVTLKTGTADDVVTVKSTGWVPVNLVNGGGHDTVVFSDGAGLSGGTITGGMGNKLDYHLYSTAVAVKLATGAATGAATGTGGASNVEAVTAGQAGGTLTGADTTNLWQITGTNAGTVNKVAYAGFQNLMGGAGLDTFQFMSPAGTEKSINGGGAPIGQGDWLDYSPLTTASVTVNLANGSATNVDGEATGAVTNIQNVISGGGKATLTGGSSNPNIHGNILIGHGGADMILGGSGPSLLIGGTGTSTLFGGSGEDILIGAKTSYDTTDHVALMSILAEWQSTDSPATRFKDINTGTGGGLSGKKLNDGTTVTNDAPGDLLLAPYGSTLNWFFDCCGASDNWTKGQHKNNT